MRETRSKRAGWRGRERERERKWLRETRWSLDEGMSWGRKRNWVIKWPSYSTFFTFVFVFSKFVTHCSLKMCHLQAVYVWRISICVKSPNARTHTHLTMRIWTMNMNTFVIRNWSIIFANFQLKNRWVHFIYKNKYIYIYAYTPHLFTFRSSISPSPIICVGVLVLVL